MGSKRLILPRDIGSRSWPDIGDSYGTGPEQGFPCVVFPHREKPVFIAGFPVDENRFFPVGNTTQGKTCFHYRDGFAVYILSDFLPIPSCWLRRIRGGFSCQS